MFLLSGAGNVGPLSGFESTTEFAERDGAILACEAARVFLETDTADNETIVTSVLESGAPLGVVTRRPRAGATELRVEVRQVALPTGNPVATVYDTAERDLEEGERRVAELRASGALEAEITHAVQQALRYRLRLERGNAYLAQPTYDVAVRALAVGDKTALGQKPDRRRARAPRRRTSAARGRRSRARAAAGTGAPAGPRG